MNSLMKRFLLCPVPDDQKPINQYIEEKENVLTNWLFKKSKEKKKKYVSLIFFSFLISLVFESRNKFTFLNIINWLNISLNLYIFILLIFFINTLFRWKEISNLFLKSSIIYEEASWFDTQYWEKPFFLIKNDTFLATQKLRPELQNLSKRIWKFFFIFLLLNLFKIANII